METPAQVSRHVVVIGAGPAGLTAAAVAARRGHRVTVLEKEARAGGRALVAARPPFKEPYRHLADFYVRKALEAGADIRFNCRADKETVSSLKPDVVLVAVGGIPIRPAFCGEHPVLLAEDVLKGAATGNRVIILGGGLVGTETAEFLAEQGKEVSILEMRPEVAADMELRSRLMLLNILREKKVAFLTGTRVLSIEGKGRLKVQSGYGGERMLEGYDSIVLAIGYKGNVDLAADLEGQGFPVIALGDCAAPGKVLEAVHGAFKSALSL